MHGLFNWSQGRVTQVSCVAKITESSQILAILLLLFGAFLENETLKRNMKEIIPKITVTMSAESPRPQNGEEVGDCETDCLVPE